MQAGPRKQSSSPPNFHSTREKLLLWYDGNRRDLPWRRTRDPYAIWIAETMLQQTQVKTVLPYYHRFLGAFPTIGALDRAPMERVLTLWSGLGYYRRARHLKAAARKIVGLHHGRIPAEWRDLIALPGIGCYTAGAILSIAFNQPFPALDGNARRVLLRLFKPTTGKELTEIASQLARHPAPGRLNQALMELGATICLPRAPQCRTCPVLGSCKANLSGMPPSGRSLARRPKMRNVTWPLMMIQSGGKILLRRRSAGPLLEGLWEIPGGEKQNKESAKEALARHLDGLGSPIQSVSLIGEIRHSITNRRILAPLFRGRVHEKTKLIAPDWRWFSPADLERRPLSSLTRKALRLAGES